MGIYCHSRWNPGDGVEDDIKVRPAIHNLGGGRKDGGEQLEGGVGTVVCPLIQLSIAAYYCGCL